MALHKKIFYFIISTLLIPSFIYARNEHYQEIERKAHAWATPLKDQLSDEEKTIIANILYISWEYSALDGQVRSIVSNLHNNAALLNQQIQNNIDATQLLKSIAAQINLLNQDLLPSRDIVLPIWEQAHIYNDEKRSLNVSAAFEALFPINEEIVLEFLTSYSQNIDDILTNANHILLKNAGVFRSCYYPVNSDHRRLPAVPGYHRYARLYRKKFLSSFVSHKLLSR